MDFLTSTRPASFRRRVRLDCLLHVPGDDLARVAAIHRLLRQRGLFFSTALRRLLVQSFRMTTTPPR